MLSSALAISSQGRSTRLPLAEEWRTRAARLGFDRDRLSIVLGRARGRDVTMDWEQLFDVMASPAGLTRGQSTFDRRDVVQALCERLPASAVTHARRLEAAADRFLASPRAVPLLPDGETLRRTDGG